MLRSIIIFFGVLLLAPLLAGEERKPHFVRTSDSLEVDVSRLNGPERIYVTEFFSQLRRQVKKLFSTSRTASGSKALRMRILFSEKAGDGILVIPMAKYVNVYLPLDSAGRLGEDNRLMNKLIAALILAEGGRTPSQKIAVPYWLSAGMTEIILSRMANPVLSAFRIYPDLHNFLCRGRNLQLSVLLSMPPEYYNAAGNTLFRESSEILFRELSSLKYGSENPFLEMAILYSKADVDNDWTAFSSSFKQSILTEELRNQDKKNSEMTDKEKLDSWFKSKLLKHSVNYFMPADTEMSERFFKAVQKVNLPDGKTCDITAIAPIIGNIKDAKQKEAIFMELKAATLQAAQFIEPSLRQPLSSQREAIFRFSMGEISPEEFSKSTETAKSEFASQLESMKKLERWTAELETDMQLGARMERYSGIMKKLDDTEKNIRPGLNQFLDDTETKFGK
ncbi:MAG: hypothetical protein A2020_13240 [Lentisphaerae bacterium GWF2_45_14]|nr:MAG: hypothetical protein A2020_13240 [Lentisphaerae bacterium GWF2_45_14]